jgi:hypothetical protein
MAAATGRVLSTHPSVRRRRVRRSLSSSRLLRPTLGISGNHAPALPAADYSLRPIPGAQMGSRQTPAPSDAA